MNQLIQLLDSALQANLSKRQWAAFAAVLRQTLGYRKNADDLSARRLAQLTGIRRNHIWQAKNELVAMGLLHSEAGHYGEILSFPLIIINRPVPDSTSHTTTPSTAPKTGKPASRIGPEPVPKQDTTLSNLTQSNHNNVVVVPEAVSEAAPEPEQTAADDPPAALRYPPELSAAERKQAPQQLDGLSPQAAQQVLDVWALKIARGEVRKSRIGLLIALVKAQRQGTLHTADLPVANCAALPTDPQQQQRQQARDDWLEQQAQQGWLRDMARLSGQPPAEAGGGGL